jgi:hypothetical protein
MSRAASLAWLLVIAAVLAPAGLSGQVYPVTPVFEIAPPAAPPIPDFSRAVHEGPLTAIPFGNGFAVAWSTSFRYDLHPEDNFGAINGRLLSTDGRPGTQFAGSGFGFSAGTPVLAQTPSGGFVMVWQEGHDISGDIMVQRFGPDGVPLSENAAMVNEYTDYESHLGPALSIDRQAQLIVAWAEDPGETEMRILDWQGEAMTPELQVATNAAWPPQLLVDEAGRILVVWSEKEPDAGHVVWWGRHFGPDGTPLGERFFVGRGGYGQLLLAPQPGGGFVALWPRQFASGPSRSWFLRRFGPDGAAIGAAVTVGRVDPFGPQLATDSQGNVAVLGAVGDQAAVHLFDARLTPRGGGPILVGIRSTDVERMLGYPSVALALRDKGRFLLAWVDAKRPRPSRSIRGRLWNVGEDDLCVYRGNQFLCDTAGNGGGAEMALEFGAPGDVPMTGDVDGDGRDEVCVRRGSTFLCDTDHDGGAAEFQVDFGLPGEPAGLADLDGNGVDDPCVRHLWAIFCDRAHDGGAHDISTRLGRPSDGLLLADIEGDGRDHACIYRNGNFRCIAVGEDGVFERTFTMTSAFPRLQGEPAPLFGDVNGDGVDDPCLYAGGKLVCGLFGPTGNRPRKLVERSFGTSGDIPVLGDVDAF